MSCNWTGIFVPSMGGDHRHEFRFGCRGRGKLAGAEFVEITVVDQGRQFRWVVWVKLPGNCRLPDEQRRRLLTSFGNAFIGSI